MRKYSKDNNYYEENMSGESKWITYGVLLVVGSLFTYVFWNEVYSSLVRLIK